MDIEELESKKSRLFTILKRFTHLGVAFSGGVDSSLLLVAARQVLGEGVVALTAESPIHPSGDKLLARELAHRIGVRQVVFESDEMKDAAFLRNLPERCYWCKKRLLTLMAAEAQQMGIRDLVHGANLDDLADFRPGFKAAEEAGVTAPLLAAGLTKRDIRTWARQMGLPNWDRPAGACLASRIPYGRPIDAESLQRIDSAEALIHRMGFLHCRVRHFGVLASIEIDPAAVARLAQDPLRSQLVEGLRDLGYAHVCLDLEGYVAGKMNRNCDAG